MTYDIFWGAGSPNSWRSLLALEVKGLPYNSKILEFSKKEHQSPKMLAMNPRGLLPILSDGDTVIYESVAIIAYLDRKHPSPPLFGTTEAETGFIWQRIFEIENYLREAITNIISPIFFDDVDDNIDSIEKSACYVDAEFNLLNETLKKQNYIAGNSISAADIILFPFVQALLRAMVLKVAEPLELNYKEMQKNFPEIVNWIKRIELIPGYEKTYPPNWNDDPS